MSAVLRAPVLGARSTPRPARRSRAPVLRPPGSKSIQVTSTRGAAAASARIQPLAVRSAVRAAGVLAQVARDGVEVVAYRLARRQRVALGDGGEDPLVLG